MMIKFYAGGASGVETAAYLEKATDHKGRPRAAVDVLRGNPHLVGQIADSLSFKHRTTSGLIAWAPEDEPSQADIDEVLDDFERLAWVGLEPDRYAWCAVRHDEEAGGVHVHILAARVDLETGKSLNIAPPGWKHAFDPLRDVHNIRHNWARPDDPARAQDVQLKPFFPIHGPAPRTTPHARRMSSSAICTGSMRTSSSRACPPRNTLRRRSQPTSMP